MASKIHQLSSGGWPAAWPAPAHPMKFAVGLGGPNLTQFNAEETSTEYHLPARTLQERIQSVLLGMEGGNYAWILRIASALIGFILLALWFDLRGGSHSFSDAEAMEAAQLGRHLAAWRGYTTYSIRPSAVGLLQRADPEHALEILDHPVPDLSIAPAYPCALACLMKVLPFNFAVNRAHRWSYQPEFMIVGFNEVLFFGAILLLFHLARKLFDSGVAWVAAIIFAGSETYWRFCLSGLSTMWLLLIFLLLAWCLVALEERESREIPAAAGASVALAAVVGALVAIGGLSRYSFAWMIIPVLLFLRLFFKRRWGKLSLVAAGSFLIVLAPWITRNIMLSDTPFGTAGYAILESTRPFEEDRVERSFNPMAAGLDQLGPRDVLRKFLVNEGKILRSDLPRLGGNWVWSFFLCGLLLPFRHRALRSLMVFVIGSLALLAVVQALGQTHISADSPDINSENLLVLLAPLVLMFGTGFFFTILHQMALPTSRLRALAAGLFALLMCAPMLLNLTSPPDPAGSFHYEPLGMQRTADMMKPEELMMSDIPWAIAWYGDRACSWLTLDDADTFQEMNLLKPVQALYLTERSTDRPFLSQILGKQQSWGRFVLSVLPNAQSPQGQVPAGFPLTNALARYMPAEIFLSDTVRWKTPAAR